MAEEKKTVVLTKERQGEIAMACIRHILRRNGLKLDTQSNRELGNLAKEIGIGVDELKAFIKPLVQEVIDEILK